MICVQGAGCGQEQPPVVHVRPDEEVDARGGSGPNGLEWWRGKDLAVDDRMERHRGRHDLGAPSLRVRVRREVGAKLELRGEHPLDRHRRHRIERRSHSEDVREAPATPERRRRRQDVMGGPLCRIARRNGPRARGIPRSVPMLIAPAIRRTR